VKKLFFAMLVLASGLARAGEADESGSAPGIEWVTPDELAAAIDAGAGLVVVDVRSESAYKRGHIPGAVNIPLSVIQSTTAISLVPEDLIVFYCDCPKGGIALKAAEILHDRGYPNLWVMLQGTRYYPGTLEETPEE